MLLFTNEAVLGSNPGQVWNNCSVSLISTYIIAGLDLIPSLPTLYNVNGKYSQLTILSN